MAPSPIDYFRYFPVYPELTQWGLGITACGRTSIGASASYPPVPHPADHHFSWEHGRVLDCVQIVMITAGRGILETRLTGRHEIEAGTAFVLLPGEWHRYRCASETGWQESWIELRGPVVDALLQTGTLARRTNVRRHAVVAGLAEALEAVHHLARDTTTGFNPDFSALGLKVLAAWSRADHDTTIKGRMDQVVTETERFLTEHQCLPVNIADLARRLGVSEVLLRRAFKRRTGLPPYQYVLLLRLDRARRLLAGSDSTLADIADRVGFSSAFHLSSAFKRRHGVSPDHWRRTMRTESGRLEK